MTQEGGQLPWFNWNVTHSINKIGGSLKLGSARLQPNVFSEMPKCCSLDMNLEAYSLHDLNSALCRQKLEELRSLAGFEVEEDEIELIRCAQ